MIATMSKLTTPKRRPTYEDILALPPGVNGEILAGELVVSPRPASPHIRSASVLGALLVSEFDAALSGTGGWWIDHEPELSLPADPDFDPVIPDLAGWRIDTMPEHPDVAQMKVAPDWVCEIVSPSTARHDRVLKVPYYARAGVGHTWLLDPVAQTLEVYRLDGGGYRLVLTASEGDRVRAEPFEELELDLAALWRRKRAQEPADEDG